MGHKEGAYPISSFHETCLTRNKSLNGQAFASNFQLHISIYRLSSNIIKNVIFLINLLLTVEDHDPENLAHVC